MTNGNHKPMHSCLTAENKIFVGTNNSKNILQKTIIVTLHLCFLYQIFMLYLVTFILSLTNF